MNEYVSKNGTKYVSFVNIGNGMCYFTTTMHLLKSSKTLASIITDELVSRYPLLMTPVSLYMNDADKLVVENAINDLFQVIKTGGYCWEWLLTNYFLPIIFESTSPETFHQICREMSLEKQHLINTNKGDAPFDIFEQDVQEKESLKRARQKYHDAFSQLYSSYNDNGIAYDCIAMEVTNGGHNGHVVALVDGEVVLDRQKCQSLREYVSSLVSWKTLRFVYSDKDFPSRIHGVKLTKNILSFVCMNKSWKGGSTSPPSSSPSSICSAHADDISCRCLPISICSAHSPSSICSAHSPSSICSAHSPSSIRSAHADDISCRCFPTHGPTHSPTHPQRIIWSGGDKNKVVVKVPSHILVWTLLLLTMVAVIILWIASWDNVKRLFTNPLRCKRCKSI